MSSDPSQRQPVVVAIVIAVVAVVMLGAVVGLLGAWGIYIAAVFVGLAVLSYLFLLIIYRDEEGTV